MPRLRIPLLGTVILSLLLALAPLAGAAESSALVGNGSSDETSSELIGNGAQDGTSSELIDNGAQDETSSELIDYGSSDELSVKLIGRFTSGADFAEGGTEIVAYDPESRTLFSVNGAAKSLDLIDLSALNSDNNVTPLPLKKRIALEALHPGLSNIDDITSVAKHPYENYIAVTVTADPKTDPGYAVFLDTAGTYIHHVQVGALPDMVIFTPDGSKALTANEGEPNDDYSINPEGSVSIIDVSSGPENADATLVTFKGVPVIGEVRKSNPDHSHEQNFEPEYIAVSPESKTAYVALQESNAIAVLDLEAKAFTAVHGLGYKDWSQAGNRLDASDKDGKINIRNWPVLSAYMPDGLSLFQANGKTYLLTPNEGDSADYEGYSEEVRVKDIADQYALNAELYEGYTQAQLDAMVADGLFDDAQLGRLKTTTAAPKNAEGKYEAIYGYGGRSFSIWDAETMDLVYDSGSDFEEITAAAIPEYFNTNDEENGFDNRSDDKGPEPETTSIGIVGGTPYAFIGLERTGGIMIYNVTDPHHPKFVKYVSSRHLAPDETGGDIAPEGLTFVPAVHSPTGKALLIAAHEVSGTVAVYELTPKNTTIQLIHVNDVHSRVFEDANAGIGYAKMAALVDQYRRSNPNTLLFDAGDTFHGQTFSTLVRGESIVRIMNAMGFDAQAAGNHDFNYGTDRLLELAEMADFPILGGNVDRDGEDVLPASTIFHIDGIRIGVFGLATPETAYKTHPNNVKGIVFADPVAEARKQVSALKNQADVIIAIGHIGMDKASTHTSDKIAAQVDGIDVIIDGHSHQVISQTISGTLVVQTGEYLKNVGVVTLTFENGLLTHKHSAIIPKEELTDMPPDRRIADLIASIQESQDTLLSGVVGSSETAMDGERETVRAKESNLGNLIADAMLEVTGADAAITNGGSIRASIGQGEITKGDIITVLPFGNYIVTLEVTGEDLAAALQHGAGDYPEPKGAFPQVAGLTYAIDPSKPKGEKVHDIRVNGEPLDRNKVYTVATNDFLAAGGDEYAMFAKYAVKGHFPALDEAVIAYIEARGTVAPKAEGRIMEKTAGADASARGSGASGIAAGETYIVKPGDTLSHIGKRYGIPWQSIADLNKLQNPHLIFPGQKFVIPAR